MKAVISVDEITRSISTYMEARAKDLVEKYTEQIKKELSLYAVRLAIEISPVVHRDITSADVIVSINIPEDSK